MKPIRVFYSELSKRFYASRAYKVRQTKTHERITITGDKFDVTDEIAGAIIKHKLVFSKRRSRHE